MNDLKYDEENQYHYNDDYVFFTKSFLSQWYGAFSGQDSQFAVYLNFVDKSHIFNCAEQAMMYGKACLFGDTNIANKILLEKHPKLQKKLGREVSNFKQSTWDKYKFDLIKLINVKKFEQNSILRKKLCNTGMRTLVEAAPWDKVWGIGIGVDNPDILDEGKWQGQNLLGKALMEVRGLLLYEQIKKEYGSFNE